MITLAIAAVLIGLTIGDLKNLIPRTQTKSAVRKLRNDLQKAKLEAVKRHTSCLVDFTFAAGADAGACRTCISTDNDCDDAADVIITELDFNDFPNVAFQNVTFASPQFVFNSRGMPEQTGGGIVAGTANVICTADAGYSFDLVMSITGRIRID